MPITIVKGEDKSLTFRVKQSNGDADDISLYESIKCELKTDDDTAFVKANLHRVGDIANLSALVTNLDSTEHISEGLLVTGTGIPVGATVLKTPLSETSPTAAGTIQLSAAATASTPDLEIVFGDIELLAPEALGKFKVSFSEAETETLKPGVNPMEVTLVKSGVTRIKQFSSELTVVEKIY